MTLDLTRLRELEKSATPGPWQTRGRSVNSSDILCVEGAVANVSRWHLGLPLAEENPHNAEFIAAARNSFREMLDEIERLREALQYYGEELHWRSRGSENYEFTGADTPHGIVQEANPVCNDAGI